MTQASEDATMAATTRKRAASQRRNEYVRVAVAQILDGDQDGALATMLVSFWEQARLLGIEGMPPLKVTVS